MALPTHYLSLHAQWGATRTQAHTQRIACQVFYRPGFALALMAGLGGAAIAPFLRPPAVKWHGR
jgi:hypothetical protein